MIARTYTAEPSVDGGTLVTVEVDTREHVEGAGALAIAGLVGKAVDEALHRVSAALVNSGFRELKIPGTALTISLAPADVRKDGTLYDLPIALGVLIARTRVRADMEGIACMGELGLDGSVRAVRGVLPATLALRKAGFHTVFVPVENAEEAALIPDIAVLPVHSLLECVRHLDTSRPDHTRITPHPHTTITETWLDGMVALEDVRGQESAKRGIIIAAAGRHNAILVGPPGTGKTMLARALQSVLPPLSLEEALEVTAIHSIAGTLRGGLSTVPPFRAPHHSASHVALVGGGARPRPGEVTLAHRGVLFLDEFPEFERRTIDGLRQPLEDRVVSISRAQQSVLFPANVTLIAAMNPTRGGNDGTNDYATQMRETYSTKISGPILDRIDLWLPVPHVPYETLTKINTQGDETKRAREQIARARERQRARFAGMPIMVNGEMNAQILDSVLELSDTVRACARQSAEKLGLSPRGYHRLLKTARTIADLADSDELKDVHILEALQYRMHS